MKKVVLLFSFIVIWCSGLNVNANSGQEEIEDAEVVILDGSKSVKVESERLDYDKNDDADFYQLNVTKAGKVTIKIDSMPLNEFSDVDISIIDKDDQVYANFTSVDPELSNNSIHAYLKKGTYFMQVNLDNIFPEDKYELMLSLNSDGLYEGEVNNSKSSANPIELNNIYQASLMADTLSSAFIEYDDESFDRDFYRFEINKDGRVQLDSAVMPDNQLKFSLWNTSGKNIWSEIRTKGANDGKMGVQFVEYLKKGTYIVCIQHEETELDYEVPYRFKITHSPVAYSEINGDNYSFGKAYEGTLLEENTHTDQDTYTIKPKEKLYITTKVKLKSTASTKVSLKINGSSSGKIAVSNKWTEISKAAVIAAKDAYTIQLSKEIGYLNPVIAYNVSSIAHPYWGKFYYAPNMLGKMKTKLTKTQFYREKGGKIIKSGTPENKNKEYKVIKKGKTFFTLSDGRLVKIKEVTFINVPSEVKNKYKLLNQMK
ncbi:PPC domain-containing protein [Exiguobacterium sp. s193]|uniref:PPC domain-containing protein n=1 Tax=Exiguobacterium sp. s193 TaxID=2751207 RepID=UPI001BE5E8A6|nr:PPC domain-containing protein [Exiguobacterium sp. s193]